MTNQNDKLKISLEGVINERDDLKYRIRELENAQKSSELSTEAMKKDMQDAREEQKKHEDDRNKMKLQVQKMSKAIQRIEEERDQKEEEINKWKKEFQKHLQRLQSSGGGGSLSLPDPVDNACILLGQMCSRVQAMMYKKVLPEEYHKDYCYKVKFIDEDIARMEGDLKDQAIERWDELKRKIGWDNINHPRILKEIQKERNIVAHPGLLTKELLLQSADLMQEAGKLHGRSSLACVHEVIEIWDLLGQME